MKIGIITFHRAENFGAVLQAYALQRYLEGIGYDVRIIDYHCPNIEAMYHIWNPSILFLRKNVYLSLKAYCARFSHLRDRRERKDKFRAFRNEHLHISPITVIDSFDAIITGSDQVWNLHLTGGFDKTYFLSTIGNNVVKKISYAASSDRDPDDLLLKNKEAVTRALNDFSAISVREERFKDDICRFIDKPISVCCDPTFLIGVNEYDCLEIKPQEKDYVLVYHMNESRVASAAADLLACELNCQIIEIHGSYPKGIKNDGRHKVNLGPSEILGYIRNAKHIITTSFHGISLSIIHEKSFWLVDKGDNNRQKNLLSCLGLNDRLISDPEKCLCAQRIDYKSVKSRLDELIQSSRLYLKESLNDR